MANSRYAKGRQAMLEGSIHWLTDDFKVVLIDTAQYTVDIATDDFLADIPVGARIATSGNLANKTSTDGVADADDITITGVPATSIEAFVIYKDTGSAATSPLIAYFDTVTGFPVTITGGEVQIRWDGGANKIFGI